MPASKEGTSIVWVWNMSIVLDVRNIYCSRTIGILHFWHLREETHFTPKQLMFLLLRQGWGLSDLGGVCTTPLHSYTPLCLDAPYMSEYSHTSVCPHVPMYICMFLGGICIWYGDGGIYQPGIECLDGDMLEFKYLYIVLSYWHALLPKVFLDYNG